MASVAFLFPFFRHVLPYQNSMTLNENSFITITHKNLLSADSQFVLAKSIDNKAVFP